MPPARHSCVETAANAFGNCEHALGMFVNRALVAESRSTFTARRRRFSGTVKLRWAPRLADRPRPADASEGRGGL